MFQFNEHINPINPTNWANKGKKYPIDFSLVKKYSKYFYNNRKDYKSICDIEIVPNNYEVPDESIPIFIACCQNKPFDINDSNVFSLHQLSIQYEVPVLTNLTTQCINKNKKHLVFPSIFYKLQNQNSKVKIDLSPEEEIISTNFFDYIDDEQMFSLPITVLYRITNNDRLKINSMDPTNQKRYIEFLFKCLDHYKREASVLFLNLDLENERIDVLSRLFQFYSNIFDFNMINSKLLSKSSSFLLSELEKLKIEFSKKLAEIEAEKEKQKKVFVSAQNSFDDSKSQLLKSNQLLSDKIRQLEDELSDQRKNQDEQKNRLSQLEEKLSEQSKLIEKFTNLKVTKIEINSQPSFLHPGSSMTLSTRVKPRLAFNDNVEWQISQETEGSVEIESKDENTLVLKGLKPTKKVTVVAKALDGGGATATKVLSVGKLNGTIEINVQQNQSIKGKIKINENEGVSLDTSKSKYLLNSDGSSCLGVESYVSGLPLDSLVKDVEFDEERGRYFLHALVVDNFGFSQELVSQPLETNGAFEKCFYDGSNQFNGILAHLTKISGGNIVKNGTINLTCHDFCCGSIDNFVDFNCIGSIHIKGSAPRWIQFDFKGRKIQLNSYTIRSANRDERIKSWKIEISQDGNGWTKIDEQNNVSELNVENKTKLIQVQMTNPFSFLRISADQQSFDGYDSFSIGKLEFFGKVYF